MASIDRRQREKAQRRQQIQDAASSLILENGYYSTKIEDIAKKIDLTPGALYRHFKNKDELFASLLIDALENLSKKTQVISNDSNLNTEEKIIHYKNSLYETYQTHPLMVRCLIHIQFERVLSNIQTETALQLADVNRKIIDCMQVTFKEGISNGTFIKENPLVYLDMFWGLFTGLILWEEAKKDLNPKKDFLKNTLDKSFSIFLSGIKTEST
ncbi:TetR/AcrR family transcriptional regulator [Spongiibacter marinus]|uniref:TetR/AcrR family transcriptional regulator n=1 Tax=Spongiibacter marinus TaxID=354246 RepID=UPI0035BE1271